MARVLITGVTGFLGRSIEAQLRADGHEVYGTTTSSAKDADHRRCDITDALAVKALIEEIAPERVIHSAAQSSVTEGTVNDYYSVNVVGTDNLLNAVAATGGVERFVLISTAGVYGNQPAEILTEDLAPLPVHHYGLSKFAAEQISKTFADRFGITIVRPFNIVGPGQQSHFIVPKLTLAFARGDRQIRLGNIDVYRDYIDVRSASRILADLAFAREGDGLTVNLCTGRGTSLRELIEMMQAIAGYEIEVISAPEFTRKTEVWRLLGSAELLKSTLPRVDFGRSLEGVLREVLAPGRSVNQ